jgi:hypothetical protein
MSDLVLIGLVVWASSLALTSAGYAIVKKRLPTLRALIGLVAASAAPFLLMVVATKYIFNREQAAAPSTLQESTGNSGLRERVPSESPDARDLQQKGTWDERLEIQAKPGEPKPKARSHWDLPEEQNKYKTGSRSDFWKGENKYLDRYRYPSQHVPRKPRPKGGRRPVSLAAQIQQAVDALPLGEMVFHHLDVMQLRQQESAQVRISQDLQQDLVHGLSSQGVTERDQIKISTSMKVRLSGEPNFDVKPLNDEEQLVTKSGYTEWLFTVLPLKKGKWPLHVVITAVVRTPGGAEKYKDYPVKDELVEVRVTTFGAVKYFVEDNWQWILTAILIPIAVWTWKWRIGARGKKLAATRSPQVMASVKASASDIEAAVITKPEEMKEQTHAEKSA